MNQKKQIRDLLEKMQQGLEELTGDNSLSSVFGAVYNNLAKIEENDLESHLKGHHLGIKEKLLDDALDGVRSK